MVSLTNQVSWVQVSSSPNIRKWLQVVILDHFKHMIPNLCMRLLDTTLIYTIETIK